MKSSTYYVRAEIVRQISGRREGLTEDRNTAREMVDGFEGIHQIEQNQRRREGQVMPDPQYDAFQVRSLETSAEILRDPQLLRDVHDWEKTFGHNSEAGWEGRAVAREITSGIAVEESKERLQHFLESKRV